LKEQTGAEIHFLCKQNYRSILEANPYIDQLHTIKENVNEILPALKSASYDCIIDLHKNIRSMLVRKSLGVKTYSFDKINFAKWMMVRFKINRLPKKHIVDRYLESIVHLGVRNDGRGLDYFIPKEQEVDLSQLASQFNIQDKLQNYIAFAIGAAHATKRLPYDKIVSICSNLSKPIILLGGPGEKPIGEQLAHNLGDKVINTCGHLTLHQSASIVRQADTVISHDTGMMHIAAAFNKKIVSIWGNTIPAFGMTPYYPASVDNNISIEVEGLSCRPCSKIGYSSCPKGHFKCMKEISVDQVKKSLL